MNKFFRFLAVLVISASYFTGLSQIIAQTDQSKQTPGGGEYIIEKTECLNDEQRKDIQMHIDRNTALLRQQGKIHDNPESIVAFIWPIRAAAGVSDFKTWGISNYVDQNNTSALLDYNCLQRTYNGHKGTDIFTWPFGWYKMDNNQVEIIAAAPGVIIYRNDGLFDRSCAMNNNNWNAIYVRHSDGSVAWYGHMKKNSVTSKVVGDTVAAGEYLGVVGSSGNSTGPHLHFEVYNSSNALIDPWQGTCNSFNAASWWADQKPYYDTKINALLTHVRPPVFPTCPAQEILNVKNSFNPGDSIYFIPYYSDQLTTQQTQYSVIQPNGVVWSSWTHTTPTYYTASYWWWSDKLPTNALLGTWTFRAVYNSVTYNKTFTVGTTSIQPITGEIPSTYSLKQNYPNPFNPETKISFGVPAGNSENIKLSVFDVSGKEVSVLVNESLNPGLYEYSFNGASLPSGMYFYKLASANFTQTRKMMLIK